MKRRFFAIFLATVACFGALFALSACGGVSSLQMNKKYIDEEYVKDAEAQQSYYLFRSNGTGICKFYYDYDSPYDPSGDFTVDYTVTFKYVYVDNQREAVVCFYDSVEYGEADTGEYKVVSDWSVLLTVSRNVLCSAGTGGYTFYVNEDYLGEIPDFGA